MTEKRKIKGREVDGEITVEKWRKRGHGGERKLQGGKLWRIRSNWKKGG